MNNHLCIAKSITDLVACCQCGINQICCNQCFHLKHKSQNGPVHSSCKLVDADVYKNFLRLIHLEWLVGQKVLKSLGSFKLANDLSKTYLVNTAFYSSQFYKEFFSDQSSAQQYLILKCYYSSDPKSFDTLSSIQKLLNEAKSLDIIKKYISKLTQQTEQQKTMSSHLDFYTGADIYYLAEFFSGEQQIFCDYLKKITQENKQFSIYKYIQWRQKQVEGRNGTYYSNEFTAFLVEYYRRDSGQKTLFSLTDYILNFWQFFHTTVSINTTLKQYIDSQIDFYQQYEQLMQQSNLTITYLGFKIWKLNNGVSKQLPYLKNHYFLFAFVQGYLKMRIQRTYGFLTQQQKVAFEKQSWIDYVKYIKDYSLLLQAKNRSLDQQDKQIVQFDNYKTYFAYRKRLQPFHELLKASKQNIYDKQVATRFFNHHFESGTQLKPKLYKQFFDKFEQEKRKQQESLLKLTQELKQQLREQQKQNFYEFLYINFIAYCKQQDIKIKKQRYYEFKKNAIQTMDQDYIKLTEQKFKRGDFNALAQEQEVEQVQEKEEEPKVIIGETGAKITVGMDKYEEQILQQNLKEDEQSDGEEGVCQCCRDNPYNCDNQECKLMGYCTSCRDY